MVRQHPLAQLLDRLGIRDIRGVAVSTAARVLDLPPRLLELVGAARDQDRDPAGTGDLERGGLADPARGSGDQHRLAVYCAFEAAVLEQVGIEVTLPIV